MVGLMKLKLNTAQQSALKLVEITSSWPKLNHYYQKLTCKILSRVGGGGGRWRRDGLNGYKANLSPAKLKLADIGLEQSLAIKKILIWT